MVGAGFSAYAWAYEGLVCRRELVEAIWQRLCLCQVVDGILGFPGMALPHLKADSPQAKTVLSNTVAMLSLRAN